jgi:hypothetical protein
MGVGTETQISVQIMAPAIAVVILEATLGAITTGGSQTPVMEDGMIQIAIFIIMEVYLLESSSWLKRQLRHWRENLLIALARESL